MKFSILKANEANSNGHVYSLELLKQIENQINSSVVLGHLEPKQESLISLSEVSHQAKNAELINDTLFVEIDPLESPQGKILREKYLDNIDRYHNSYAFKCYGVGCVDNEKNITSYELISIDLCPINKAKPNTL